MSLYTHKLRVLSIHFGRETVPSGPDYCLDRLRALSGRLRRYIWTLHLGCIGPASL